MQNINNLLLLSITLILVLTNQAYGQSWNALNGPVESDIRDIEIIEDSIFVVNFEGGVFKKGLNDTNWYYVETLVPNNLSFQKLDDIYFVGSVGAARIPDGVVSDQLFVSDDFGNNWFLYTNSIEFCHSVSEIFLTNSDDLLAGCTSLYKLDLQNASIQKLLPVNIYTVYFIYETGDDIFTGTNEGVYRTSLSNLDFELFGVDSLEVYSMLNKSDSLFFVTSKGLFSLNNDIWELYEHTDEFLLKHIIDINENIFVLSEDKIYEFFPKTNDFIENFSETNFGSINTVKQNGDNIYIGSSNGLFKCSIVTYSCSNESVPGSFIRSTTLNDNHTVFVATISGIYRYSEPEGWDSLNIKAASHRNVLALNNDTVLTTNSPFVNICDFTITSCDSILVDPERPIFDIELDDNGYLYVLSNRKVFKSIDYQSFEEIEFTDKNDFRSLLTVGDSLLFIYSIDALIRKSLVTGDTTQTRLGGYGIGIHDVSSNGVIIGSASEGIVSSTDLGEHWGLILNNSHFYYNEFIASISITDEGNAIIIFTKGSARRIFVSNDGGKSWGFFEGSFNATVTSSTIWNNEIIYVGTEGGGAFSFQLPLEPSITISNEEENQESLPNTFVLHQNYPNPFNPSTNIDFTLPVSSVVDINVYDITGRQVSALASGQYSAGTYSVIWDASGFATGVYIYRITARGENNTSFTRSMKMLLLKQCNLFKAMPGTTQTGHSFFISTSVKA